MSVYVLLIVLCFLFRHSIALSFSQCICLCLLVNAKPLHQLCFFCRSFWGFWFLNYSTSGDIARPSVCLPYSSACCILRLIIYRWVLLQSLNRFTASLRCAAAAAVAMRRNAVWFTLHRWLISFCDLPQAQRSVAAVIDSIGQMSFVSL